MRWGAQRRDFGLAALAAALACPGCVIVHEKPADSAPPPAPTVFATSSPPPTSMPAVATTTSAPRSPADATGATPAAPPGLGGIRSTGKSWSAATASDADAGTDAGTGNAAP